MGLRDKIVPTQSPSEQSLMCETSNVVMMGPRSLEPSKQPDEGSESPVITISPRARSSESSTRVGFGGQKVSPRSGPGTPKGGRVSPSSARWSCSRIQEDGNVLVNNIDLAARSDKEKQRQKKVDRQWADFPFDFEELFLSAKNHNKAEQLQKIPACIIDPGGIFRISWDLLLLLLLGYIAVVSPIRLGFALDAEGMFWVFEATLDVMFLIDVILNFLTAFRDSQNRLQTNIFTIARNYVLGFFIIDLVSSIPFDLVIFFADVGSTGSLAQASSLETAKTLKAGKLGRVIKMIKFSKMLRLARSFEIGKRLMNEFEYIGQTPIMILRLCVVTLMVAHFNACCWAYLAQSVSLYGNSWMLQWGVVNSNIVTQYLSALYWSSTMLMTAGSSGVVPQNDVEVGYSIAMVILGGFYYSFVIASLSALFNQANRRTQQVSEKVASIKKYLKKRHIPKRLSIRVLRFYRHYYTSKSVANEAVVLGSLGTALRNDVATYVSRDIFQQSHLFRHLDCHSKTKLLSIMRPYKCFMGDLVYSACERHGMEFYVVMTGTINVYFSGVVAEETLSERQAKRRERSRNSRLLGGGASGMRWEGCKGCIVQEENTGMPCAGVLEIRSGSSFGELCSFGVTPVRISTAEAMETAEMYMFHRDDLMRLFQLSAPHVLIHLVRVAKAHLTHLRERFGVNVEAVVSKAMEQDVEINEEEKALAQADQLQSVLTTVQSTQKLLMSHMTRQRNGEEAIKKGLGSEHSKRMDSIEHRLDSMTTSFDKRFADLCKNVNGLAKVIKAWDGDML